MIRALVLLVMSLWALPASAQLRFNFVPDAALAQRPGAVLALERAGNQWGAFIKDPITVNIGVSLVSDLPVNTYANASPAFVYPEYSNLRPYIDAPLPVSLSATLPRGFTLLSSVGVTQANAKALGLPGLPVGLLDGLIRVNANVNFDTDNRNGVSISTLCFESVMAHEIGHILGVISTVDTVEWLSMQRTPLPVSPFLMDLYRFDSLLAPVSPEEFAAAPRRLSPGGSAVVSDGIAGYSVSTGITGNGWSASHLKPGEYNAIMNPSLAYERIATVTGVDAHLAKMLNYNVSLSEVANTPEPSALLFLLFVLCLKGVRRK